jgi:hypothetical protein
MDANYECCEKVVLKGKNVTNILKLIILVTAIFFIAKVRFELGGGWLVDSIFIFACSIFAFLYSVSSEAKITCNGEQVKVKLLKNLLGVKFVSISNGKGALFKKITTSSTINLEHIFENRVLSITDMNQSKVEVSILKV